MTFGAAVLDWFQPMQPAHRPSGTELIARHVRQAIQQPAEGSSLPRRWHQIQVEPWRGASETSKVGTHFLVDRQGECALTKSWRAQRTLGPEGVVRIGLLAPRHSNEITRPQKQTAQSLIQVLRHECGIPEDGIHWDDTLAVPPSPAPFAQTGRPNLSATILGR
jgi:hypothetical protein